MIAVALGLISLVVMVATGVVASSSGDDHLTFLGVGVQTTTAQVFVTGAIFGWLFLVAIWLLRIGVHRSSERCAALAARRGRRPADWLGFGDPDDPQGWGAWDDWAAEGRGVRFRTAATENTVPLGILPLGTGTGTGTGSAVDGGLRAGGGAGPAGHGRRAPWRADRGADQANRAVAGTAEQLGALGGDRPAGPVAGRRPGVGMDGGAQRGQVGGGSGPVAGEDGGAEGENRHGDGGQQRG
ncbi:hypothetical protein GCM10009839_52880 [Catenulispora yoronensis]|uniref:Uncharacterized protein n=1 Tax=Catenulispora yoronensis TaxID=450799 RepID=A0ABP5GF71_9ACTN